MKDKSKHTIEEDISEVTELSEKHQTAYGKKRRRGAMLYRIFLMSWIAALLIVMSVFLGKFYDYLDKYETDYRASRPEVITEDLMILFRTRDVSSIYDLLTVKPEAGIYESENEILEYMEPLLDRGPVSFSEVRGESTYEHPVFSISSGDSTIARAEYDLMPGASEDDIPKWNLSLLDLPVRAEKSVDVIAPENITIFINGTELSDPVLTNIEEEAEAQKFFDEYVSVPPMAERVCQGLYMEPTVTAYAADGSEVPVVYDSEASKYYVDYPRDCPDREAMENYAAKAVSAYASFVSGDLPESELRRYFTPNNRFLYYMTHAGLTYFTRHLDEEIHSTEILDFISYSDDAFYCEVKVEQYLTMEWGPREPEILITDGKFYFVRINDEWKVSGIEF